MTFMYYFGTPGIKMAATFPLRNATSRNLFSRFIGETARNGYRIYPSPTKILTKPCTRRISTFYIKDTGRRYSKNFGAFSAVLVGIGCASTYANCWFGGNSTKTKKERAIEACEGDVDVRRPRVLAPEDSKLLRLTLYQYQVCPFCCKLRAFLDYFGYDYTIVEVEPVMRRELKWSEYRKVPILVQEDPQGNKIQMNDSSVIISALTTFMVTDDKDLSQITNYFPTIKARSQLLGIWDREVTEYTNKYEIMLGLPGRTKAEKEEKKWRSWADNVLVHYIPPNIYRTPSEASQAFDYISSLSNYGAVKAFLSKYVGAGFMYLISKRLKKKYNLKPDVRESLYDASREWMAAVGDRQFMGGDQPNLADLAVYGVILSMENMDAFNDMVRETSIGPWFYSTKKAVDSHAGKPL